MPHWATGNINNSTTFYICIMTLQENISSIINDPLMEINPEWVDEIREKYPYFLLPAALMMKRNSDLTDADKAKYIPHLALNAVDRDALAILIDDKEGYLAQFYPQEPSAKTISTNDAIDTFLGNYGGNNASDDALLEKLIFNPTPDYAQLLADEEEHSVPQNEDAEGDSQDALINAFIIKSREQQGHYPAINNDLALETKNEKNEEEAKTDNTPLSTPENSADDSMLSESLAKIYIKQRKYSKAYEIIRNLSLNFPEKSIYFADQLRFLQKLMINQRYIQSKK